MTPQYKYDNHGKAIGVFLPIEDWNQIKKNIPDTNKLPQWQMDILDHCMMLIQQNAAAATPLEDFILEMEKDL